MKRVISGACILVCWVLAFASAEPARADTFPSRPIHFILPYAPGGIIDFVGRVLGKSSARFLDKRSCRKSAGRWRHRWGRLCRALASDGYNIVIMDPAIVINPTLQKSMPYDIFKDLTTVSIVVSSPEVLVVSPTLGVKTYAELVAYGKANPGKLNYASAGVGTAPHLAAELWKARTGIDAIHVPYKGIGPSFVDLMSGKVQMSFSSIAGALPFTSKGSVIALATTGLKRSAVYPDLPTVAEAGLPGYSVDLWLGVYGPAGMPPDVLTALNGGINKALKDGDLKAALAKFGVEPTGTSLTDGAAFTKDEYEKWRKVIIDGHITLD